MNSCCMQSDSVIYIHTHTHIYRYIYTNTFFSVFLFVFVFNGKSSLFLISLIYFSEVEMKDNSVNLKILQVSNI